MFPQRLVGFNSSVTSPACTTCHCHTVVVVVAVVTKSLGLCYAPLRFTHTHTHTHTRVCVTLLLCLLMRGQCFTDTYRVLHYCRPTDRGQGQRFTDRPCIALVLLTEVKVNVSQRFTDRCIHSRLATPASQTRVSQGRILGLLRGRSTLMSRKCRIPSAVHCIKCNALTSVFTLTLVLISVPSSTAPASCVWLNH